MPVNPNDPNRPVSPATRTTPWPPAPRITRWLRAARTAMHCPERPAELAIPFMACSGVLLFAVGWVLDRKETLA